MILAHVKWFTEERAPLDWSRLLDVPVLAGVAAALAGVGVLGWLRGKIDDERMTAWIRRPLRDFLPLILSVHLALALGAYAIAGRYLAPSLPLPQGTTGTALTILQMAIAVLLAAGFLTRPAAFLLAASGPIGMLFYGVLPILERVELLGIALYLAVVGRRRWSLDSLRRRDDSTSPLNPFAVALLRLCGGVALIVGALTEKLLAPEVAGDFLQRFPHFNLLRGFGVSDTTFGQTAGAIELAMGLILLSGVGTRAAVLMAVVPFNLTLLAFGWTELIGHLPIYGIFLVLLVEGSGSLRDPRSWREAGRIAAKTG